MRTASSNSGGQTETPVHPLAGLLEGWNRFWFRPADPTPLGLIRILAGLFTLYVHISYSFDLQELMGKEAWVPLSAWNAIRDSEKGQPWELRGENWDEMPAPIPGETEEIKAYKNEWWGVDPRHAYGKGYYAFSIWFHVTDPTWMVVTHATILVIMFMFTIGLCTRITSVLTWLGALSYIQRAPTTLFGMDTMMNLLLFYLMIGPSGAALSVDRLIARYWAQRRARRKRRPAPVDQGPPPSVSANLTIRLLQVNLCIIYLAAGLSKLQGRAWWTGVATWGTMAVPEFSPMQYKVYMDFLEFLCKNRWLWEIFMTGSVAFTLFVELGFPFLVWNRRLRWVMLCMALGLHLGIGVFMGLRTFSLMMTAMICAFLPEQSVQRFLHWLGGVLPAEPPFLRESERLPVIQDKVTTRPS